MSEEKSALVELSEGVGADPNDPDFQFGAYVFGVNYHLGLHSVEYRAVCETGARLRDNHFKAIEHGRNDPANEWEEARIWYRKLKRSRLANAA
jgi:hypothetical protein